MTQLSGSVPCQICIPRPSPAGGTLKHLQEDAEDGYSMDTGSPNANQLFYWSSWHKGYVLGGVLEGPALSRAGGQLNLQSAASEQGGAHAVGRKGLEGRKELCCRAGGARPASLDSALHKQAKASSSMAGLSMQKRTLLLFPLNFGAIPVLCSHISSSAPCQLLPSTTDENSVTGMERAWKGREHKGRGRWNIHARHWTGIVSPQKQMPTDGWTVSRRAEPELPPA